MPGIGEFADGANALIYLGEGDKINAGLSAAAMVPFIGISATGTKLGSKALGAVAEGAAETALKHGDDLITAGKNVAKNAADDVAQAAGLVKVSPSKLQQEYKHSAHFGVTGNWNKANGEAFLDAINSHIEKVGTPIRGNMAVYHYYNHVTKLNVMVDMDGKLVGVWKLTEIQEKCLQNIRNVQ
ncbi:MAG: colicin D domain-containing protein [Thermoguttaceae bacterium]